MLNFFAILRNVRARKKYSNSRIAKAGFTLVELALVLVIIGLVVGGVLVGKELIHSAEIRSTMKQAEEFTSASKTYTLKYNCLAGDCTNATTLFTGTGNGDGNGQIGGGANPMSSTEDIYFWQHLALANLISGSYTLVASGSTYLPDINYPSSKMGGAFGVWNLQIYSAGGAFFSGKLFVAQYGNNLLLGTPWGTTASKVPLNPLLSGYDAFAIDSKFDDGLPAYGKIMTWQSSSGYSTGCATTDVSSTAAYSQTTSINCGLFFTNAF